MNHVLRRIRPRTGRSYVVTAALLALTAMAIGALIFQGPAVAGTQDRAIASAAETGKAFSAVTKKVAPAVVFIKATMRPTVTGTAQGFGDMSGQIPDELLKRFFGDQIPNLQMPRQPQPMVGQGSGFIISKEGHILTNNHVVGNADSLEVTLRDGRVLSAKLVGTDAHTDVAIIKVDATDLPVLPLGDSDKIEVGEWVLAVGSPFGLIGTVTSGIVSAKGRDRMGLTDYENFIQTDAAINPGNSGGPLVNLQGEAIGINTAILSRSGGYNGIGFAIPMNMAKQICAQLIKDGSVTRGYLGVMIQRLTPELAKSFSANVTSGVLIGDVPADGPAARAGLQRGDVVVELNGAPVKDITSFRNRVALLKPQTDATLVVLREGVRKTITVTLGKLPDDEQAIGKTPGAIDSLGLSVQTIDQQLADKLGTRADSGVVVTRVAPGSEAAAKGLRPGVIIKEVNRKAVKTARQFADAIRANKDAKSVLLLVQAGEHTQYVVLDLKK